MMLRNRSRPVTKPSLMGDHTSSQQSPNKNYVRTTPSLFGSQKLRDFTMKCLSGGAEALRSPTSILDTRALLSPHGSPISPAITSQRVHSKNTYSWDKVDSKGIGLALVGELKDDDDDYDAIHSDPHKPNKGKVLFGTKFKIKIPSLLPNSPFESKTCANADFGAKAKDSENLGTYRKDSDSLQAVPAATGVMRLSEMELSEEYTCVISHGVNPRTTHIFDNCVVESYFSLPNNQHSAASVHFLNFCYTCKKHLEQTKDIFIYRGEKAFCSQECRHQEMVLDGAEN
ncbi:FCS-Like Zinc finger 8-like [Lotus japonicus]|uniref:FCS-Like Zinc finger 8-like n=1 Tax=Lotus japonicus TaxID=34305 RepID=UPI002588DD73|nr:FCS-Like Zinc finger 8-like [Lotus japonicus]XP_057427700.1 FCS-Like Zinc finger 8-like [Lotus japonicus]